MAQHLRLWQSFTGKLYLVFGALLCLVAAVGVAGYVQLARVQSISSTVVDQAATHRDTQHLAVALAELDADLADFLVVGDGATRQGVEDELVDIERTLTDLEARRDRSGGHGLDVARALEETQALKRLVVELVTGDQETSLARNVMIAEVFGHLDLVRGLYDDLNEGSLERTESSIVKQAGIISSVGTQILLVGVVIMVMLAGVSLYVRRTVRSIGEVTETALAVASGDLERDVPVHSRDEIGLLAGAFNSMTRQLRELIGDLEHRVHARTSELSEVNAALQGEIVERERAEVELRRSKEFAETVLNSMSESIAIVNIEDFTIAGANKVFLEAADQQAVDDVLGLRCYTVTHGRDDVCCAPDDVCPLKELTDGHGTVAVEHLHRGPGGETRHAEVSVSPIHDESGEVTQVVHVSRDITERKVAEEALRDYALRLEAAVQELGETQSQLVQAQKLEAIGSLAAGVAHEINTPIQYVGDNTRFLQEAFDALLSLHQEVDALLRSQIHAFDERARISYRTALEDADIDFLVEEVPTAIDQTIEGANRVAEIVRALKDFSHPGGDSKEPVEINDLISNTVAVSKNEWKYVADLVTEFDPDLPSVPALKGPLGQVLLILIVNAAQAISEVVGEDDEEMGTITITTGCDSGWARIEVSDTGGGIPDEIRDKVFEHFFTTKEVGKGSGQGLAIARSIIVEQHQGEIDFTSVAGVGTTFCIRIPVGAAGDSAAA